MTPPSTRAASVEAWLGAAASSLRASPLRTLLSTLGVVIGVAALVAILALSDGLEGYARDQLAATTDVQTVTVAPRVFEAVDGLTIQRDSIVRFGAQDARSLATRLGEAADVTVGWTAATRIQRDTQRATAVLIATLPSAEPLIEDSLVSGRFLTWSDVSSDARVAVLSVDLLQRLGLGDEAHARERAHMRVMLDSLEHTVVGLVAPRAADAARRTASGDTAAPPGRVYIPLSGAAAARLDVHGRRPPVLRVRARRVEATEQVRDTIDAWLEQRFGDTDAFVVSSYRQRAAQARTAMLVFRLVMGSIAGVALLVGGIGIMNILLASVSERTREIGIRKAIGARSRDILLQFLSEAVAISAVGSVIGVLLGLGGAYGLTALIRHLSDAPLFAGFSWISVAVAAGTAVVIGLAFGTYPARRAARLSPIDAIRHE